MLFLALYVVILSVLQHLYAFFFFQNCLVLLHSNAMFLLNSRWRGRCFHSTSTTHEIHQPFSNQWTNALFFAFWLSSWQCHSFSVSIETSELFSWLPHFSLALFQSIISSWKEYLEQLVTNWEPRKKRKKENYRFTYLLVVYTIQELEKATQKKNLIKPSNTHESFYICHGAVGIGWTKLWISKIRPLHNSKNTWEGGIHFPSLQSHV